MNTKSAAVRESLDLDMIMALPLDDRDNPHRGLLGTVAGAMGASNSANARVRGGSASQTVFTQDGFDMRDQMPTMKSSAAYEIMTGGHGGEAPTASGAAVNLVTRGGSNRYEFEFNASIQHSSRLRFFLEDGEAGDPNYKYVFNPTFSGPDREGPAVVLRELGHQPGSRHPQRRPSGIFPARPAFFKMINKGTIKLTWQMTRPEQADQPDQPRLPDGVEPQGRLRRRTPRPRSAARPAAGSAV